MNLHTLDNILTHTLTDILGEGTLAYRDGEYTNPGILTTYTNIDYKLTIARRLRLYNTEKESYIVVELTYTEYWLNQPILKDYLWNGHINTFFSDSKRFTLTDSDRDYEAELKDFIIPMKDHLAINVYLRDRELNFCEQLRNEVFYNFKKYLRRY